VPQQPHRAVIKTPPEPQNDDESGKNLNLSAFYIDTAKLRDSSGCRKHRAV
jgi:hypothetical protein